MRNYGLSFTPMIIILFLIYILVYVKHVLYGGPGLDDELSYIVQAINNSLPLSNLIGPRPERFFYGLTQYFMATVYKDNYYLYIITQMTVWIITLLIIYKFLIKIFDKKVGIIFLLLSPYIISASAIVYSPYKVGGNVLSLTFWSIHIYILTVYLLKGGVIRYLSSYLFLLFSLFTVEYIIGYLIISCFFPFIYIKSVKSKLTAKNFNLTVRFVSPVLVIVFSYVLFKIFISKLLPFTESMIYGYTPISMKSIFQCIYYFITIFLEFPLLLFEVIPHLLNWNVLVVGVCVVIFYFLMQKKYFHKKVNKTEKLYVWMFIISLMFCSSIFLLSGYPSLTFGPYNKMMLPSFLLISILFSYYFSKMLRTRLIFIPTIISILWISSMVIQVNNFCSAWQIRQFLMNDINNQLQTVNLGENPILVANIPYFLSQNYNNEPITYTIRSFRAHLKLVRTKRVFAFPICYRIISDRTFYPAHNILNYLSSIDDNSNFWYYEFEEGSERGVLEQLSNKTSLLKKFDHINFHKINHHPIILREKIRLAFRKFPLVWNIYIKHLPDKFRQNI